MGACLGSCAGTCLSGLLAPFLTMGEAPDWRSARVVTLVFQVLTMVYMLSLQALGEGGGFMGSAMLKSGIAKCKEEEEGRRADCFRTQASLRVGFSAGIVLIVHLLGSLCGPKAGLKVMKNLWVLKFLSVPLLALVLLLVPNSFFTVWEGVCLFVSVLFLLQQMVAVLDFSYSWNELWVGNAIEDERRDITDDTAGRKWYVGLMCFSLLFLLGGGGGYWAMLAENPGSKAIDWFLGVNLGVSLVSLLVSVTSWAKHGALLPSSVVMGYVTFLSWFAVQSREEWGGVSVWRVLLALVLYVMTIMYMCFTSLSSFGGEEEEVGRGHSESLVRSEEGRGESREEEEEPPATPVFIFFNLMNFSGAAFLTLLCSSFLSPPPHNSSLQWWVLASSTWLMQLLYGWTLAAPRLMPDRFD